MPTKKKSFSSCKYFSNVGKSSHWMMLFEKLRTCFSRGSNTEYTCYNISKYPFIKIIENERIVLRTLLVFFLYLYILAYFVVLAVIVFKYYLITQKDFLYKHIK